MKGGRGGGIKWLGCVDEGGQREQGSSSHKHFSIFWTWRKCQTENREMWAKRKDWMFGNIEYSCGSGLFSNGHDAGLKRGGDGYKRRIYRWVREHKRGT